MPRELVQSNLVGTLETLQIRLMGAQIHASADDLRAHQSYIERLEHMLQLEIEDLARCEVELSERRVILTKASQDLEALERLKEKGLDDHNREAARVEQNMLDEIAGNGYWRRAA